MARDDSLSPESFIRLPEVLRHTAISRGTVYRLAAEGAFPRPYKLGKRSSGWKWGEICEWLESRKVSGGATKNPDP